MSGKGITTVAGLATYKGREDELRKHQGAGAGDGASSDAGPAFEEASADEVTADEATADEATADEAAEESREA